MPCFRSLLLFVFLCSATWTMPEPAAMAQGLRECPAGTRSCGTVNCCRYSDTCSPDGFCYQLGETYCGNGRTCPRGQVCTNNGLTCAPAGSMPCGPSVVCSPGTVCVSAGICAAPDRADPLFRPGGALNDRCQEEDNCLRPGWFRCEDTGSQCRPGFKCSKVRGCVPVKAVDCGEGRWCRPGEICLEEGGCAPDPEQTGQD